MSKKPLKSFLKYSGMGFSMLGTILGGYFLGQYLDEKFNVESGWKAGLTLFGVFAGLYLALKDFISPKND